MIIALQTLIFFRHSLLSVLDRFFGPYYKRLTLKFSRYVPEDEEEEEDVFADFDDEKGVVFFPPVYSQRYAAVSDCLMDERWCGKLDKIVDLGYHDMSFIKYLKEMPGVRCILGVDIESIPLRCSSDLLGCDGYIPKREHPLKVTLFQGNAADPDYRLIGCDAVVAIEMIEHMMPQDLDRLVHTVFGFIKPWIAIFTTPNGDFNVLFKALEKNGLRRLDHFFEWSREQFHDWCSNIVARYPQFTVTCRGIGPGPPGTHHLGCCSQLALFINKEYAKQQDLSLDSLALVANVPSPQNVAERVGGWESPVIDTENILCPKDNMESLTDFLYSNKESCITIVLSPAYSLAALGHRDKTSQCNIDKEIGKNFLMFNDEEMCFTILMPRRKLNSRVYEIEDVTSRLNCTTFQVKKFSKPTQNLMAKNRSDSLIHTRDVVNEIRHLTKMLNFNKEALTEKGETTSVWCNINWGENAPYWNQYYRVVKEYSYPFEVKSDESRIIETISDEINRMIDSQYDEECSTEVNKMEIPIDNLMRVVGHMTDDVDKVKDLLQWNGYEVVGDTVIHTRAVADNASVGSWDDDTGTDLDTINSTSLSDGSTVPDFRGRCLRRALDKKMRSLREMVSADEDITAELDKVICRLLKLALRTSRGKQAPPPARWLQCKLLDLLTLTEKALSRRKQYYLENFPLKAIGYEQVAEPFIDFTEMKKENHNANMIVERYNHLLKEVDKHQMFDLDFGFEDTFERDDSKESLRGISDLRFSTQAELIDCIDEKISREGLHAWTHGGNTEDHPTKTLSLSDHSTSNGKRYKYSRTHERGTKSKESLDKKPQKRSHSKITGGKPKLDDKNKSKKSKTSLQTKTSRIKSTSNSIARIYTKRITNEYANFGLKSKRIIKEYKKLQPTASKPIPGSLIELCHPELAMQSNNKDYNYTLKKKLRMKRNNGESQPNNDVAATEDSLLIDIVMDDKQETIALRRSIGTDADYVDVAAVEQELVIKDVANASNDNSLHNLQISTEIVQSQTIFLYDINEPSTSKGVRHVSMDVQCGTDQVMLPSNMLTPPPSVTRIPKMFTNGIKIDDSLTNLVSRNSTDNLSESAKNNGIQNFGPVCTRIRSPTFFAKGIKLEDSIDNLTKEKYNDLTIFTDDRKRCENSPNNKRTAKIRIKDSLSEIIQHNSDNNKECQPLSPKRENSENNVTIIRSQNNQVEYQKFAAETMRSPSKRTLKIKTRNSISDLLSRSLDFGGSVDNIAEEYMTLTARSKSPDILCGTKVGDSLTNVLADDNGSINLARNLSRSLSTIKGSPFVCATDIKLKDSFVDVDHYNSTEFGTVTTDDSKHCTRDYKENNGSALRLKSPVVFDEADIIITNITDKRMTTFDDSAKNTMANANSHQMTKYNVKNSLNSAILRHTSEISTCTSDNGVIKHATKSECLTNATSFRTSDFGTSTDNKVDDCINDSTNNFKIDQCVDVNSLQFKNIGAISDAECTNNTLTLKTRCFGFKVKDIDENVIKKVEFSTTRVELISDGYFSPIELESSTTTELLKPVSSKMKVENSSSEFCCSNYCCSPDPLQMTSDLIINQSSIGGKTERQVSPTKLMQKKLSCGGVHIHSFKEKQTSEDIVFQGEWQRQCSKPPKRQSRVNPVHAKNFPELTATKSNNKKVVVKDKKKLKKPEKKVELKIDLKKPLYVRNHYSKLKQENKTKPLGKVTLPTLGKVVRANSKNLTKVTSKIGVNSITSKSVRSSRILQNKVNLAPLPIKRDCDIKPDLIRKRDIVYKNYLPNYLKKKKNISEHYNLNQSFDSVKTSIKKNKDKAKKYIPPLVRSNTEEIKSDLVRLQNNRRDISYFVFCNEINNGNVNANNSQSADNTNRTENLNKKRSSNRRSSSPISIHSSACSSPESVATVKAMTKMSNRKYSTSSNKSSMVTTDSEAPPHSTKTRKYIKRSKINKKPEMKDHSNKENIPESSKTLKPDHECLQNVRSSFFGRNKKIFMAQVGNDSGLALNGKHQTPTKSNIKIPAIESSEEKKRPRTATILKRKSNDSSFNEEINKQDSVNSEDSNMVLLLEPQRDQVEEIIFNPETSEKVAKVKVVDSNSATEWIGSGNVSATDRESNNNTVVVSMREILDERLTFISRLFDEPIDIIETTNSSLEDFPDNDDTSSLKSYKTVVPSHEGNFDSTLRSEIENAMNRSFDAIAHDDSAAGFRDETEFDMLSFKSVTSTSRYSEYFLADNELNNVENRSTPLTYNARSVRDIFERNDLSELLDPAGAFAVETFSGFSMNIDPVAGDQPDYVNLIDSETGSVALNAARQAPSEELFVSGRSSESYASCLVDEDAVVPNWLFQIISQQQSIDNEDNGQELVPLPLAIVEPIYDVNGNVVEPGVGLGAGAGDGRGMHSDHSQDSSGRGSTLSSSVTSSSQQSEGILIDPSAFTQLELLGEPIGSSMAVTALVAPVDSSEVNRQGNESESVSTSRNETLRIHPNPLLASDGEADVSSLDTDVPDYSDN